MNIKMNIHINITIEVNLKNYINESATRSKIESKEQYLFSSVIAPRLTRLFAVGYIFVVCNKAYLIFLDSFTELINEYSIKGPFHTERLAIFSFFYNVKSTASLTSRLPFGRFTPRSNRGTPPRSLTFSTSVRVIYGIHSDSTNNGPSI